MAIQSVVKSFNAKRTNGTFVFRTATGGREDITKEAATGELVDTAIANEITARRDAAQGNVDELNEVLSITG
jgi:hypothetical protein